MEEDKYPCLFDLVVHMGFMFSLNYNMILYEIKRKLGQAELQLILIFYWS